MVTLNRSDDRRKPASRCSVCGVHYVECRGQRIVAGPLVRVGVSDSHRGGGNPEYPEASFPLDESKSRWLVVKGRKGLWTDEGVSRAIADIKAGVLPWICHRCAGRSCRVCGGPKTFAPMCDWVNDSGRIAHSPYFTAGASKCLDVKCRGDS